MPEYIVTYVVTQVRFVRLLADSEPQARDEIRVYHEQHDSERVSEAVQIISAEKD